MTPTKGKKKMATETTTANEVLKIEQTVTDLNTFEDVTLVKTSEFVPVTSTEDALARIGGNAGKFLDIVNEGLRGYEREALKSDNSKPWLIEDEETKALVTFNGVAASEEQSKSLGGLILNLAKALYGYAKDKPVESKREAKEKAKNVIRTNPEMLAALKGESK